MMPFAQKGLAALGSLHLTLIAFGLLGGGVVLAYESEAGRTWPMVFPLLMLFVNLVAAVLTRPVFRSQTALLVFHLALIVLIGLIAAGRLTYLRGWVEMAEGQPFPGQLTGVQAGPWHWNRLDRVHFENAGFTIDYGPEMRRGATYNRVVWTDADGARRESVIGDQSPLVIAGYRFYTSFNKGFSPVFRWEPRDAAPAVGAVNLPSYPANDLSQAIEWTPPGASSGVWVALVLDQPVVDPERASTFRLPEQHRLVIRAGELRHELVPGEAVALPEGRLVYLGLRTWMGYTVFNDWTIPWLLATCLVGLASLAWHFWRRFAPRPWLADEPSR
jgi:hypothetical protein